MSNFIKRNLAAGVADARRRSKLELLLDGFARNAERAEQREEEKEGREEPAPRGLPRGFRFRRRIN